MATTDNHVTNIKRRSIESIDDGSVLETETENANDSFLEDGSELKYSEEDINTEKKGIEGNFHDDYIKKKKKEKKSKKEKKHSKRESKIENEQTTSKEGSVSEYQGTEIKKKKKKDKEAEHSEHSIDSDSDHSHSDEDRKKKKKVQFEIEPRHMKNRTKSKTVILEHKRSAIGEIIYKGHPSWVLMQNIQTGIRYSVSNTATLLDEDELKNLKIHEKHDDFFKSPPIRWFPSQGSQATPAHKAPSFKFKDYCPIVFRHLREKFEIDPSDYLVSLCHTLESGQNALMELPTPGKSGSLFLFSQDQKYILKTIPKREAKILRKLLPDYYHHVMRNENTLLPKFFGLHRVKPHKGRQVRFVVMGNIFETYKKLHERYDLKGSIFGRSVSQEEKDLQKENVTYKDVDWREKQKKLYLGPKRQDFLDQLAKDCQLLEKLNIMDYSLLVGIHNCSEDPRERRKKEKKKSKKKSEKTSKNAEEIKKEEKNVMEGKKDISENTTDDESSEGKSRSNSQSENTLRHKREKSIVQTSFPLPSEFKNKMISIFQQDDGGIRARKPDSTPLNEYYYLGIIDILMIYTVRKKIENTYKSIRWKTAPDEISAINPVDYSHRFQKFIAEITE